MYSVPKYLQSMAENECTVFANKLNLHHKKLLQSFSGTVIRKSLVSAVLLYMVQTLAGIYLQHIAVATSQRCLIIKCFPINLYCTLRGRIKNKINEIEYNNTAHIKYTSEKKKLKTHTHHKD